VKADLVRNAKSIILPAEKMPQSVALPAPPQRPEATYAFLTPPPPPPYSGNPSTLLNPLSSLPTPVNLANAAARAAATLASRNGSPSSQAASASTVLLGNAETMAAGRWRRRRCVARRASADGKAGGGPPPRIGELARGFGCISKMSSALERARRAGRTGVIGMRSWRVWRRPEIGGLLSRSPRR